MSSLSATLSRPIARLAVALGVSVCLIGSSLQLPISLAEGELRPLHAELTRQIASSGDDVNEDGANYEADYGTVWFGTGANAASSYTGLRFTNIAIPQGATITSAKLQVYLPSSAWNQLDFTYAAENAANSAPFSSSNRPSQRTLTSQSVSHSSNEQWPATTWYDLDEISSVVQPVISRGDWTSGNALSIILKGVGGAYGRKYVVAYDGTSAYAVRLAITYSTGGPTPTNTAVAPTSTPTATRTNTPVGPTATATTSGGGTQLTRQIASSSDDVNEDGGDLEVDYGTVWFGTGANASASYTGLRFTNIAVPQGATITSAKLQVYLSNAEWNQLNFIYAAENVGNSEAFSSSSRPSQRSLTSQTVSHSSNVQWPADTWIDLDEIGSVVQPVISRSDWTSGNALALILRGTTYGSYGRKFVTAYDGTPANAIRLAVTYSIPGATATSTATTTTTRTATPVSTFTATRTPTQTHTATSTSTPSRTSTPAQPTSTPISMIDGAYPGPDSVLEIPQAPAPYSIKLPQLDRGVPVFTYSRYVTSVAPADLSALAVARGGCGPAGYYPGADGFLVLSMGQAWWEQGQYGAIIFGSYEFETVATIETGMHSFIDSYVDCVKSKPHAFLTVALYVVS